MAVPVSSNLSAPEFPRCPACLALPRLCLLVLPADADEVDFDGFLRMLKVGSYDSLDALEQVGVTNEAGLCGGML